MNTNISVKVKNVKVESGEGLLQELWRRFRRNKLAMLGLIMTVTIILAAVSAGVIAPYDPIKQLIWTEGAAAKLASPSLTHPMGTDLYGRDIFSRVLYGARISLQIGIFATLVALLIGVPLGALAGYKGGICDDLISWLVNVVFAFPFILFVLAVVSIFQNPSLYLVFVAIGLIDWVFICRVTRGQFISLRSREFVEAAHALGLPTWRIIFRHILPNVIAPIIIQATLGMGGIITLEAGLAYLGFGAQPPTPSWGLMISEGQQYIAQGKWWWSFFPGVAIMYTVLAFNFLGDGLRDALDVRQKR
ncbi:MAG: ABC transporter permease [Synergistaceae bacterium]|jgi:peptide/nickel transport system permease protein/oligopeptide transport system permease protein|nr:ABC transporter permease [Synergistaceae bacterium]